MPSSIPPGPLRRTFGRERWFAPEPYGEDGWLMVRKDRGASVIVSVARWEDDIEWVHASIAMAARMPDYLDLVTLHRAVFGTGFAYQCFVPPSSHVNIHEQALHLWGRLDGANVLPDFGKFGSI